MMNLQGKKVLVFRFWKKRNRSGSMLLGAAGATPCYLRWKRK